jgi:antitoxin component YwqK of YwqJK toxin-antitoxin module
MSGIHSLTVNHIQDQIKASQEGVLKCIKDIEMQQTSLANVLTKCEGVNTLLTQLGKLAEQFMSCAEVKYVKVKDPLEELKKLKLEFDRECEKYDNDETRQVYESENLKVELLYPDKKLYFFNKIIDLLCLYQDEKISSNFKDIFLKIFNLSIPQNKFYELPDDITLWVRTVERLTKLRLKTALHFNTQMQPAEIMEIKQKILSVRDIRWLLVEMEKYPKFFQFAETDLQYMLKNNASRDNINLVKKFLKKEGDYEEYYPEEEGGGIKERYRMSEGKLNGEYKIYNPDSTLLSITSYLNGEQCNDWTVWHPNGQKFVEGKITGLNMQWYPSGKIMNKYSRVNNIKQGEYLEWYENGNLWIKAYHSNDKLVGDCEIYHFNGKICHKFSCIDGQLNKNNSYYKIHGNYQEWDETGFLIKECSYQNGKLNGLYKVYDKNVLILEKNYKDDLLDGPSKMFKNEIWQTEIWEEGCLKLKDDDFIDEKNFKYPELYFVLFYSGNKEETAICELKKTLGLVKKTFSGIIFPPGHDIGGRYCVSNIVFGETGVHFENQKTLTFALCDSEINTKVKYGELKPEIVVCFKNKFWLHYTGNMNANDIFEFVKSLALKN